jgi:hypothetical protein
MMKPPGIKVEQRVEGEIKMEEASVTTITPIQTVASASRTAGVKHEEEYDSSATVSYSIFKLKSKLHK